METYRIVRFQKDGEREIIGRGFTLEDAKEHCNRDDTQGPGWFDGFERE